MSTREIGERDVILREGAVDNIRHIASKYSVQLGDVHKRAHALEMDVASEELSPEEYYQEMKNAWQKKAEDAAQLLHGLSYLLEGAKGGSVTPEDETSLIGAGWLVVGLIDHGESWSAHS